MSSLLEGDIKTTAMNQQTLYIAFDNHQVCVRSNIPKVLTGVERSFKAMLNLEPKQIVGQLEVWWQDGEYHLLEGSEASAKSKVLEDVLCWIKYEVVIHLIHARPDLLWLHAGAAAYQGSAVVVSGLSGRGKSTLVTSLCDRGWSYLSDDILPLDLNSGKVMPFPRTPEVRKNSGQELLPEQVQQLKQMAVELKPETVCPKAMPIKALVFPTYSLHFPTQLLPYSPATAALELLQNCVNFAKHKQTAVRHVCEVVKCLPTFSLTFNDGNFAAELIHKLQERKVDL